MSVQTPGHFALQPGAPGALHTSAEQRSYTGLGTQNPSGSTAAGQEKLWGGQRKHVCWTQIFYLVLKRLQSKAGERRETESAKLGLRARAEAELAQSLDVFIPGKDSTP